MLRRIMPHRYPQVTKMSRNRKVLETFSKKAGKVNLGDREE